MQDLGIELRRDSTPTTRALLASLPIESAADRWGDEMYFEVPFHSDLEDDARQVMDIGEVAFWPDGDALAVFFGRTPSSTDDRPKAYSPCNIVGRIVGDARSLGQVRVGDSVRLFRR